MINRADIERELDRIEQDKIPPTGYDPAEEKFYWIRKTNKGPIVIAKSYNRDIRLLNIMRGIQKIEATDKLILAGREI